MSEPIAWIHNNPDTGVFMIEWIGGPPKESRVALYAADEIERKDAAIDELAEKYSVLADKYSACADRSVSTAELVAEIARSHAAIAELVGVLVDAVEMVETWGAYADEYFQNKWNLEGDIAKLQAAIAKYDTPNGPDFEDGCSLEGFVGGCERMGCHDNLTTKEKP